MLHWPSVASRYPRLGVARDPELDRALKETRELLGAAQTRSAAAHIRALALRGAESVKEEADAVSEELRRFRERYQTIPRTRNPSDFVLPEDEIDPHDPTPATDALRWAQGKE